VAITAVGTIKGATGTAISTFSLTPTTVGNCFPLAIAIYQSAAITVTSVTGGGCTWAFAGRYADTSNISKRELWIGTVTSAGSASTVTVVYSGSVTGDSIELDCQEFTNGTGAGTTWTLDGSVAGTTNTASTSCTFPTLTPSGAGELYFGHWFTSSSTINSSPTSGYATAKDAFTDGIIYNPACSASAQSPTGTISTSNASYTIAMLVIATAPGGGGVTMQNTENHGGRARFRAATW
jgi:hypothetical protein